MFCSEFELGNFLGNSDVITDAYQAISEMNSAYELHTSGSGYKILSFNSSPEYTTRFLKGEYDIIPSEKLQVNDFISTKVNSSFLINEAAVELFQHIGDDLKELENKHINTSLVITGAGLGGYLAILSTLRLHQAIDVEESNGCKNTKRPICITFGSPFIGDMTLQNAISERPQWKSSFLNVVAKKDPVASFFSSNTPYKPLGTFLFCTESGGHAAFEDQDSILLVLDSMKLWNAGNLQLYNYTNVLNLMRRKILYGGTSELDKFDVNSLRAGITMQLKEVGVLNDVTDDEIGEMEKKQIIMNESKDIVNAYEPNMKLNDMNISLTHMTWYVKTSQTNNPGYYDCYKKAITKDRVVSFDEILFHHDRLNDYWKEFVEKKDRMPQKQGATLREEKDPMPQKEGATLRARWLYLGTNYRRIVEPLDIAIYYRNGNTNYMASRSNHYKLLERWFFEGKKSSKSSEEERNKAASLTEDSCFWAHVEEALISLRDLVDGGSADNVQKLEEFEAYVMREINSYSVSPDIFLEGSTFMKWWNEYKAHKGTAYTSEFVQYMNSKRYRDAGDNTLLDDDPEEPRDTREHIPADERTPHEVRSLHGSTSLERVMEVSVEG